MVSILSIAAMCFAAIVPIGLLVVLLILAMTKFKAGFRQVAFGAGVMLVFAFLLEGLVNRTFLVWVGPTAAFFNGNILAYCLYAGLMAGIFEETGRFIAMKLFFKNQHEWKHGVAYGLGHGGLELLCIGGLIALTNISNIVVSVMINVGKYDQIVKLAPAQSLALEHGRQQLISLPASTFLIGAVERIDTLFIQLALSILVLYAVAKRRYLFYLLAILIHAAMDFTVAFTGKLGVNMWLIELIIFLIAIVSVIFIIQSRKLFMHEQKSGETPAPVGMP